jgi:hypothetical protein
MKNNTWIIKEIIYDINRLGIDTFKREKISQFINKLIFWLILNCKYESKFKLFILIDSLIIDNISNHFEMFIFIEIDWDFLLNLTNLH